MLVVMKPKGISLLVLLVDWTKKQNKETIKKLIYLTGYRKRNQRFISGGVLKVREVILHGIGRSKNSLEK